MKLIQNGIVYELNHQLMTAKVIESPFVANTVFIPRSIIHDSKEYLIVRIESNAFKGNQHIYSVIFDENSEVKTIGNNIFSVTNIIRFSIPAKLETIEEGWCQSNQNLIEIEVSPTNKYFKLVNDQILIMSNKKNDEHTIIFVARNTRRATIPSHVTRIAPFSFQNCNRLEELIFESNSKLNSIGQNAFQYTNLTNFYLPPNLCILEEGWCSQMHLLTDIELAKQNQLFEYINNEYLIRKSDKCDEKVLLFVKRNIVNSIVPSCVTKIGSFSFSNCESLKTIKFNEDSKLKTISKCAFYQTKIESLSLPSSIENLEEGWCINSDNLNQISVSEKNEKFIYLNDSFLISNEKVLLFARRNITDAVIPSFITKIESFAFHNCSNLIKVTFQKDSSLFEISDEAFSYCMQMSNISPIPKTVKRIGKSAFQYCEYLESIEFEKNSCLEVIDDLAFDSCQYTQSISEIPKSVKKIGKSAFGGCDQLKSISFQKGAEIEYIGKDAFSYTSILTIPISEKVKGLSENFLLKRSCCMNFEISPKNEFNEFDNNEFLITKENDEIILNYTNPNIEDIFIPSKVTRIGLQSFKMCKKLKSISFMKKSNIKSIGDSAFAYSSLEKLEIPESLEIIEDNWLFVVRNLNRIDLSPLNKNFELFDNKILIRKIDNNKYLKGYDLLFAPRNIKTAIIPSFIARINNYAFFHCIELKSISFNNSSSLMELGNTSFGNCNSLKSIVSIPSSLKIINGFCFSSSKNLSSVEFLSDELTFNYGSFFNCSSLKVLSFVNAKKIKFRFNTFYNANDEITLYALRDSQIILKEY